MIVEGIRDQNGNFGDFPVGMRVLAVDDDPTCLKLLDVLLKKCQYHVTTTTRATIALKMLRENKDSFDLVISDVHMPDMDGFKLLEIVGLEMDLPVIMLSANGDPKLVMKGVTHGACDYLVKPIRIEELRNIWQHVIRRKFDNEHQKIASDQDRSREENTEVDQRPSLTVSGDQNGRLNKKRKDDKDEAEENENENVDPITQKKPRVVWSMELHGKFVAAVKQLGFDKAVPKRILDLMNVEGLTRENVASHLQKYRLYLKRVSSVAAQPHHRVSVLESNIRMGSIDGLKEFQTLVGPRRLHNTLLSQYSPNAMLGRLNSSAGVNLRNLPSSMPIGPNHSQNDTFGQFSQVVSPSHREILTNRHAPLELDQLLQNNSTTCLGDLNPTSDSTFTGTRVNALLPGPNGSEILQANFPNLGGVGNQCSVDLASFSQDTFSIGVNGSSRFLDPGKLNESWQSASQLLNVQSHSSPLTETVNDGLLPLSNVRENHSSAAADLQNHPDFSSANCALHHESSRGGLHCQGFFGDISNINQLQNQLFGPHVQKYSENSDNVFSSLQVPPSNGNQNMNQNNAIWDGRMDTTLIGRSNGNATIGVPPNALDLRAIVNEDYVLGQKKPLGSRAPQSYDVDHLINALVKQEQDGATLSGQLACSSFNFSS